MKHLAILTLFLATALFMAPPLSSNTIRPGQPPQKEQSAGGEELRLPQPSGAEQAAGKNPDMLSITSLGKSRNDITGKPLMIPEEAKDASFLDGNWSFEKEMLGPDGQPFKADFSFDKSGKGSISLVDQNNIKYHSSAEAEMADGVLRIRTSEFTSKDSPLKFNPEFIECRNGANGAQCVGEDGFGSWEGERIFASRSQAAPQRAQTPDLSKSAPAGQNYAELSADGAELSPTAMAKSEKAKSDGGLGALQGDWRFSHDLARKSDGQGVGLEFHFDQKGNGYSVIKDGSAKDFRAEAKSTLMPDGTIRVKTETYENGSDLAYYPTFMECKGKKARELNCNVSNGWMRVEDGRLVSLNSYEKNLNAAKVEGMQATEPAAEQKKAQEEEMADLFASVNPGKEAKPEDAPALVLPEKGDSVSFLAGSWLCKTDLARTSDNQPIIVQFSFDKEGKGVGIIREQSGEEYRSSARASYRNGVLRINTSQFDSPNGRGSYSKTSIECRDRDGKAICRGKNAGILWEATFLRQE